MPGYYLAYTGPRALNCISQTPLFEALRPPRCEQFSICFTVISPLVLFSMAVPFPLPLCQQYGFRMCFYTHKWYLPLIFFSALNSILYFDLSMFQFTAVILPSTHSIHWSPFPSDGRTRGSSTCPRQSTLGWALRARARVDWAGSLGASVQERPITG